MIQICFNWCIDCIDKAVSTVRPNGEANMEIWRLERSQKERDILLKRYLGWNELNLPEKGGKEADIPVAYIAQQGQKGKGANI